MVTPSETIMTPGASIQVRTTSSMEWAAIAVELFDLLLGQSGLALVGDLVPVLVDPDVDDVGLLAGLDHASVAEELLAKGLGLAVDREAVVVDELGDAGVGLAVEEGGGAALGPHGGAVEPGAAAERGDHLVDELASALVRALAVGGGGWRGAGNIGGLRVEARREQGCEKKYCEGEEVHARSLPGRNFAR
jgi:hypothetical protein